MKALIWLACIAGVAYGGYRYAVSADCGKKGAVACPPAELEEGVGETVSAAEFCPRAGYLCVDHRNQPAYRWPLDKGKLKVRVGLPEFASGEEAERLRGAAIEGIMVWDGRPFPIVLDKSKHTFGFYDIGVVWAQGLWNEAAGLARPNVEIQGKRVKFSMGGMAIVVPPQGADALARALGIPKEIAASLKEPLPLPPSATMSEAQMLARVRAVATHEMGHALGLLHSDSEEDIMFPLLPQDPRRARATARDFRTIEALYSLPNGATLR